MSLTTPAGNALRAPDSRCARFDHANALDYPRETHDIVVSRSTAVRATRRRVHQWPSLRFTGRFPVADADYTSRSERRRESARSNTGKTVAAVVVALVAIGGGAWACNQSGSGDENGNKQAGGADKCAGAQVTIAANPTLSGALTKALEGYNGGKDDQGCERTYSVQASTDSETLNQIKGGSPSAQIWVSDNPGSFDEASKAAGAKITPGAAFASSPAIISGPADQLKKLGTDEASWQKILSAKPAVTVADITHDRASALAVTAASQALGTNNQKEREALGQLALTARDSIPSDAPYVTSEAALAARNAKSSTKLAEIGLEGGSPLVKVTAAKMIADDPQTDAAYDELMTRLTSAEGQKAFAGAGYRSADGSKPPSNAPQGADSVRTTSGAGDQTVSQVVAAWAEASKPLRLTTVVDVSGSMKQMTDGVSRIEAVSMATRKGLDSLPASTSLAVWEFSTEIDGKKDYKELLPMSSVSDAAQRKRAEAAIEGLPGDVKGDTALYDTIWAAFQSAQKDYKDGQVSTVLLVTDGRNDDPKGGLTLSELKKKLQGAVDPKRPVDISTLAVGQDVNTKELSDIAKITGNGGKVYTARTPQDVPAQLAASLQDRSSN